MTVGMAVLMGRPSGLHHWCDAKAFARTQLGPESCTGLDRRCVHYPAQCLSHHASSSFGSVTEALGVPKYKAGFGGGGRRGMYAESTPTRPSLPALYARIFLHPQLHTRQGAVGSRPPSVASGVSSALEGEGEVFAAAPQVQRHAHPPPLVAGARTHSTKLSVQAILMVTTLGRSCHFVARLERPSTSP
jgi:hypothetical protein